MRVNGELTVILLLVLASFVTETHAASKKQILLCPKKSKCPLKLIKCPTECPKIKPDEPNARKGCYLDCNSPKCEAICRNRKPNCNARGAACFDPRFIGGDGIVFYFHGRKDEYFSLVSDSNLQINARFIGLRPLGRTRDYTWIQALGIMYGSHKFSLEAKRGEIWDTNVDHLQLSYNGEPLVLPQRHNSEWRSTDESLFVERTAAKNSVTITLARIAEVSINVVPVTDEEDRVHNYQLPSDDCFAHLEVQFRFFELSPDVEGVIGRTYRPDFDNPAKKGVAMPVVGGEDKYRTSSLLSSDCSYCKFSPSESAETRDRSVVMDLDTWDCTSRLGNGYGIVCKK